MSETPTIQDKTCAAQAEQESAKQLSEAIARYLLYPCEEHEVQLQHQIKEHREKWMYLRVR